jgi:predicted NBD/HSP70 family sugar kinase
MRRIDFTNTQVASSETARDINRSVVLNLIRTCQPISRADLARLSGLQRSTVSAIAEQLIGAGWVVNGQTGHLPRGRHPTFLRLNEKRALLVVDVRTPLTTVAVADINGRFLSQETLATPDHPKTMAESLAGRLKRSIQGHTDLIFEGIGVSLPGRFDHKTQRVVFAPNLKWPDFDLKGTLERTIGMRVELENAANACVLAEMWFGNTGKIRDLVVVTVSEGIGTGIFSNGQLARGLYGMAGEFGHVSLNPEGPQCSCGRRGCWEVYASNRAALRYYQESSPSADGPTFQDLLSLAETGDALAVRALERMARAIGSGMRMIVAGLAPEEIVVVGDITHQWRRFGTVIEAEVAAGVLVGKPPRIRPAEGLMARLRGTVALVLQRHFGSAGRDFHREKVVNQRAV